MFFFPVGSSTEVIENYFKIVNENKNKKSEEIKDKQRMKELKTEMHNFLNKKHTSISTSGMMYYSYLYIEYSKLAKKYNDWELL